MRSAGFVFRNDSNADWPWFPAFGFARLKLPQPQIWVTLDNVSLLDGHGLLQLLERLINLFGEKLDELLWSLAGAVNFARIGPRLQLLVLLDIH